MKKDARTCFRIGTALLVGMAWLAVAPLAAEQASATALKAADAARVAYEKSGAVAAAAVEDDGFMSSAELAQKKAEAQAAGDPEKKASWESAWQELEAGSWTLEPAQVTVTLGAWDRDKKQWPLAIASLAKSFPVATQMLWNIASEADPKAAYDAVNAQAKAKTLVGRLNYHLVWQGGSTWRQLPDALVVLGKDADGAEVELGQLQVDQLFNRWDVDATNPAKVAKAGLIDLVTVAGGGFKMGDSGEDGPIHAVTVSGFKMGRTEVTQAQYQAITGKNPSGFAEDATAPQRPVEKVSWDDAVAFCNQLSAKEGLSPAYATKGGTVTLIPKASGYRLPTEAEWEYAARGGTKPDGTTYAGSEEIATVAWYSDNGDRTTHPVATKAANGLGLYDMSGNVWDWCWDWYADYGSAAQTNPTGAAWGTYRVRRGGSWGGDASGCAVSYRGIGNPIFQYINFGFRVVRP